MTKTLGLGKLWVYNGTKPTKLKIIISGGRRLHGCVVFIRTCTGNHVIIGLIFTVIGLFVGHIILFDSIFLAAISGVICNQIWNVHPAMYFQTMI